MTSTKRASLDCTVLRGNAFDKIGDLLGTVWLHDDRGRVVVVRVLRLRSDLTALSRIVSKGIGVSKASEEIVRDAYLSTGQDMIVIVGICSREAGKAEQCKSCGCYRSPMA